MYYTLYKIINNIDGKIYIGVHRTKNLDDGYFGSGKYLNRAINKHGIENFTKEIMQLFPSQEQMYEMEGLTVDQTFVDRKDTYNLKIGGEGGYDYLNSDKYNNSTHSIQHMKMMSKVGLKPRLDKIQWLRDNNPEWVQWWKEQKRNGTKKYYKAGGVNPMQDKKHTEETKRKMSLSAQGKHDGDKNSQYGTCWIFNPELKENKKISKDNIDTWLKKGYFKGRKMKF